MLTKFPKDDAQFTWTRHIKNKMMFYGLSESRIKNTLRNPKRVEEGIAPRTVAAMQPKKSTKRPEEIWVMYQTQTNNKRHTTNNKRGGSPKILMISAWRYPGVTKPGAPIPIPDDVLAELTSLS